MYSATDTLLRSSVRFLFELTLILFVNGLHFTKLGGNGQQVAACWKGRLAKDLVEESSPVENSPMDEAVSTTKLSHTFLIFHNQMRKN